MKVDLRLGDCREVMATIADGSIDAIVCDPPYELGFMGRQWDKSGIAYDGAVWSQALRVLKPGGHLLAFGGTRTCHRMVCAIEDAGFEIRDRILLLNDGRAEMHFPAWVYSGGFPKSHNIGKAIDRMAGAEREVIGADRASGAPGGACMRQCNLIDRGDGKTPDGRDLANVRAYIEAQKENGIPITAPATEEAKQWDGWGTALAPAHEPICVARKPFRGTVAENVLKHGTGAINVAGCRIGTEQTVTRRNGDSGGKSAFGRDERIFERLNEPGRWPKNVILDGSEAVAAEFPETGPAKASLRGDKHLGGSPCTPAQEGTSTVRGHNDDGGSASRFFYSGKASRSDRGEANNHVSVKPLALMRYLVRLVTPPGGVVLDPFMGSGSTGRAAVIEGFHFVGIELNAEYYEIAKRRVRDGAGLFAEEELSV